MQLRVPFENIPFIADGCLSGVHFGIGREATFVLKPLVGNRKVLSIDRDMITQEIVIVSDMSDN